MGTPVGRRGTPPPSPTDQADLLEESRLKRVLDKTKQQVKPLPCLRPHWRVLHGFPLEWSAGPALSRPAFLYVVQPRGLQQKSASLL